MKNKLKELAKEKIITYEFFVKYSESVFTKELDKLKLECWKLIFKLLGGN